MPWLRWTDPASFPFLHPSLHPAWLSPSSRGSLWLHTSISVGNSRFVNYVVCLWSTVGYTFYITIQVIERRVFRILTLLYSAVWIIRKTTLASAHYFHFTSHEWASNFWQMKEVQTDKTALYKVTVQIGSLRRVSGLNANWGRHSTWKFYVFLPKLNTSQSASSFNSIPWNNPSLSMSQFWPQAGQGKNQD